MNEERAARRAHQEWLGFVQPVGLVVSIPALEKAQCFVDRNIVAEQQSLLVLADGKDEPDHVPDFRAFATSVLGWREGDLVPGSDRFSVPLPEHQDELRANLIVGDPDVQDGAIALVMTHALGIDFDAALPHAGWSASPEARIERLLRETGVPIGIAWNQSALRLVYAPRGESSGHVTFRVKDMLSVSGRPILAGLVALLSTKRVFDLGEEQRLPAILRESRQYQNEVSTKLAEQVLGALHELLRGFQVAHDASEGRLLQDVLREAPNEVYGGLLTTLLRLVFILYAEDRGLVSKEEVYVRHYSVGGLFEKLREDHARYPDTMDQRYGAWARLIALFRLIHDGVEHGTFRLPPRYGRLFDPDAYPFLEGRARGSARQLRARLVVPRVSDGAIHRLLDRLLILDGDRLSYRTLDVEQIGSVYEAMMGFELETVGEPSIALRGKRKKGAPPADSAIGLETLLASKDRAKHLSEKDVEVSGKAAAELKDAKTIDALVAALGRRISPFTPSVLPAGSMVLEPTEERRRSGSHYTPRILTEPIVEKTLRPVLEGLGERPTAEQILGLKVCDPAMGSGAFLVAACRALGDALVEAWARDGGRRGDDELARRMVAQRCLYGVDKNPFAVDLAKLSLWLVTLAKDQPFTFVDHALRCGDSLVGLSLEQIGSFDWAPEAQVPILRELVDRKVKEAEALRGTIQSMASSDDVREKQRILRDAEDALFTVRRVGDLVIEAFFSEEKDRARRERRKELESEVLASLDRPPEAPEAERLRPFHWELEFPEVFARPNPGFDAFAGNPPFLGGTIVSTRLGAKYLAWLVAITPGAGNRMDLVAYFLRRAFTLLRATGTMGLIATNTVAQGDTRSGGLLWIRRNGGIIFAATRRYKWPGSAAVIVSPVHVARSPILPHLPCLDGRSVASISAYLFSGGPDDEPTRLQANGGLCFEGYQIGGQGFLFADNDPEATPTAEMKSLLQRHPPNASRIAPYIGGEEVNTSPTHAHSRYAISFGQMTENEARAWPDLLSILAEKVRPARARKAADVAATPWWLYWRPRPALTAAIAPLQRVLVCSKVTKWLCFAWLPANYVYSHKLAVFAVEHDAQFAALQSRAHEVFALFSSSTMKDDLNYSPSDSFDTFPFPLGWETDDAVEAAGQTYYEHRAALMVKNDQGLTATYNRFHDPDERDPEILHLRDLHAAMDRAVLDAYGWTDLDPRCEFLLDYEEDEDEDASAGKKRKKKPWRYRWPDDVRDEVLARLLALNAERAAEEKRLGDEAKLKASAATPKPKKKGASKKKPAKTSTPDLFPDPEET